MKKQNAAEESESPTELPDASIAEASQLPRSPGSDQLAKFAYSLWEERGCPEGSPDQDWFDAERRVGGEP